MIERRDNTLHVGTPLTMASARTATDAGLAALGRLTAGEEIVVDLGAVAEADSSALAVLLAWQRAAAAMDAALRVQHAPTGLQSIARVYGAESLLPGLVAG